MNKGVIKKIMMAFVMLSISAAAFSTIYISEIMPCNISTYLNKENDFTGWVEFYNDGKDTVNLKGWTLSNMQRKSKKSGTTEEDKWSWEIDFDFRIPGGGYKVMSVDAFVPNPKKSPSDKHAPYKVDPDGGTVTIESPKGEEFSLPYDKQIPHLSYGINMTGTAITSGYMEPSPKEKNNSAYTLDDRCEKPSFTSSSAQPGVYKRSIIDEKKKISLECATSGVTIRYTLDGKIPTESSSKYDPESTKIRLDSTTYIRARAFKKGALPSEILTGSFILYGDYRDECDGDNPPVVSIVTDNDYFYDKKIGIYVEGENGVQGDKDCIGMYANFNQDWSRAVNFEYFVDGKQKTSQEAVVGVMGGCSRQWEVKSLKISTNKRTGVDTFGYKFFKDDTKKDNIYTSLQLRNGGNGWEEIRCRDGFVQNIAQTIGNLDYQAYIPVSFYFNGQYKGFMGLRERTNDTYIKSNYGYDEDKIDLIEFTEKKLEASCGDLNAYNEMIAFVSDSNNYKSEKFVDMLNNYMDVDEYTNYMIFEQFIVNTDWPGNNQKCWRKHVGGKFRWILYDTDFSFGRFGGWEHNYTNKDLNTVKWCTGEGDEHNWANASPESGYPKDEDYDWKTILFRSVMKNKEFRSMYLTKAMKLVSSQLSKESIQNVKDSFYETVKKEQCANHKKFNQFPGASELESKLNSMVKFAGARDTIYIKHLAKYCGLDPNNKSVLVINTKGDFINKVKGFVINGVETSGNSFKMKSLKDMDMTIKPVISEGYAIKEWIVNKDTSNQMSLSFKMSKDTVKVYVYVQEENYDKPNLFINEICAKSEYFIEPESGKSEDWIELYNASDKYVDVAGYYLKDGDTTIRITTGYELTNIPPKGHLLLWADGRGKSGAQHLGFKIKNKGETIELYKNVRDSIIKIDKVTFQREDTTADYSYGRVTDGSKDFKWFSPCENYEEFSEATPGEANGKYNCDNIMEERTYPVNITCASPNVKFEINGKIYDNNASTYILKGKSITVNPILPKKVEFVSWDLSTLMESTQEMINRNTEWYYHSADSAPSGDWKALNYNVAKWSKGKGRMGYSARKDSNWYDTDIPFEKGDSAKYMTTYYRTIFNIKDTSLMKNMSLHIMYDDGAAVYLNGKELARYNLPNDKELKYDVATPSYIDDQEADLKIKNSNLKMGDNVLAIEVHQIDRASSDLTMWVTGTARMLSNYYNKESYTVTPTGAFTGTLSVNDKTSVETIFPCHVTDDPIFYPNPTENIVHIKGCKEKAMVTVLNQLGQMFIMQYVDSEEDVIDLSKLAQGTYIINVTSGNNHFVGKVIKR